MTSWCHAKIPAMSTYSRMDLSLCDTPPPTKANHVPMICGMEENILLLRVCTLVRTHYMTCWVLIRPVRTISSERMVTIWIIILEIGTFEKLGSRFKQYVLLNASTYYLH